MKRSHENPSSESLAEKEASTDQLQQPESGFIGRWSRRKRNAVAEEPNELPEQAGEGLIPEAELAVSGQSVDESSAESADGIAAIESQAPTDEDMPDIETLHADSDFSPFFSEGVSKELRNLALKKLFFSGKFSVRDGLDDYDDDFTKFEPLGDTVTSDMKFHARRKEKARLAELEEQKQLQEQEHAEQNVADTADNKALIDKDAATEAEVAASDSPTLDPLTESENEDAMTETTEKPVSVAENDPSPEKDVSKNPTV